MITLPTNYSNFLKKPHEEVWLFRLYNNTGSFVGIATDDASDDESNEYFGVILNKPSIRERINLHRSTSSVSNLSITIANFTYNGNDFSKELVFGTNYYINQDVKIYSLVRYDDTRALYFNEIDSTFAAYPPLFNADQTQTTETVVDNVLLYTGRLESVSHDHNKIRLNIVAKRPWDDLMIPNTKTSNNIYIPISYGNFTKNSNTTYSSPAYLVNQNYRPIPFESSEDGKLYFVSNSESESDAEAAIYDKNIDYFIPCEAMISDSQTSTISKNSAFLSYLSPTLKRGFSFRGVSSENSDNAGSSISWTNTDNAFDTSTSTYAALTETRAGQYIGGSYRSDYLLVDFPVPTGTLISGQINLKILYDINATYTPTPNFPGELRVRMEVETDDETTGEFYDYVNSGQASFTYGNQTMTLTGFSVLPENIKINGYVSFAGGTSIEAGASLTWDIKIRDIYITTQVLEDSDNIDMAFTGADGLDRSYSSGNTTEIQEAHRDLIHRYTSLDLSSDPDGWSDLDTARSGWDIRYWLLEPKKLKDVLNHIAYEGGFIYRMRQDNTLHYIHIPDTPSNDHTVTQDDIARFSISHTPFSDIITKSEYEYEKHPAENRYISTVTVTNSTTRTNYNIDTEDNVKKITLNALVASVSTGTGANASHANYYNELNGEIRIIISCDVVNPQIAASMEVGDIVYMTNMPVSAFGEGLTMQFVLTSLKKSPGNTSIELFQISNTSSKGAPS